MRATILIFIKQLQWVTENDCFCWHHHRDLCPEMDANEMHELFDIHHKVARNLNSVKHEVMNVGKKSVLYEVQISELRAFLDVSVKRRGLYVESNMGAPTCA